MSLAKISQRGYSDNIVLFLRTCYHKGVVSGPSVGASAPPALAAVPAVAVLSGGGALAHVAARASPSPALEAALRRTWWSAGRGRRARRLAS